METNKPRSGKLIAVNDVMIRELLNNPDYKVLDDGTVMTLIQITGKRSVKDSWRVLIPERKKEGYCYIAYKYKRLALHRIMYLKYNQGDFSDLVVNHIDGNPSNNRIENLEMVPQGLNNTHRFRTLNRPAVIGNKVINQEIANQIREMSKNGKSYREIMKVFNLSKSSVSGIVNNKTWVEK